MTTPEKFNDHWLALIGRFPDFSPLKRQRDRWVTSGRLPITDAEGTTWEVYAVDLILNTEFPRSLPVMFETAGKIKPAPDWHVNGDGSCCVGTDARQFFLLQGQVSLLKWVEKLAIPYLANHKLRDLGKSYAGPERSHGTKGVIEEYEELFPGHGAIPLLEYLRLIAGVQSLPNNVPCFCKSGRLYKRCYLLDPGGHRKNIPTEV